MCMRLRDLTNTYLQVCQTLEELFQPQAEELPEDAVLAKAEQIRQMQFGTSMYGIYGCADWAYVSY